MTEPDWDDARLEAAFSAAFDRAVPAGLVERTLAAVREPEGLPARRWMHFTARWRVSGLIVSVALAVGVLFAVAALPDRGGPGPTTGATPGNADFATYDEGTFHFTYPGSWAIHTQMPSTSGFGQVAAILGTLPVDPACGDIDLACYYQEQLLPGTLTVQIGTANDSGTTIFDLPRASTDRLTTVNGLPAVVSDRGHVVGNYDGSDLSIGWQIATPMSPDQVVTVEASIKGPGTDVMRAQVEALVASLAFEGPSAATIPPGPAGAALAGPAAARAMSWLDLKVRSLYDARPEQETIYRCIPLDRWSAATGGSGGALTVRGAAAVSFGPNGRLGGSEQVSCSGTIEAMGGTYWKLVLTVASGSDSSQPGVWYIETDWLTADGTVLQSTGDGRVPASLIDQGPDKSASAAAAAAAAISGLISLSDFYRCFPTIPGTTATGVITSDPIGATTYTAVPVTCTTNIEPRPDRRVWRLVLDARWSEGPGRTAGDIVGTIDVDAAGNPGTPVVTGDPLPQGPRSSAAPPTPQPSPAPS